MSTIQNVRNVGNPQRAYEYELTLLGNAISGTVDFLKERVMNVNIPEKSTETIEINYKSGKGMWAGRDSSPHTFTVQFWDDENHSIYNMLTQWFEVGLLNSTIGGGVSKDLYAIDAKVDFLAHDSEAITGTHKFTKVFPSSIGDISLDYSSSEHVNFSVTFSYDSHTFVTE